MNYSITFSNYNLNMKKVLTLSLYLFLLVPLWGQLQRDSVNVLVNFPTLESVKAADLDGDGDQDIVGYQSNTEGHLSIYENLDGQGTFGPPKIIGDKLWWQTNLLDYLLQFSGKQFALADMDNDGDIDIIDARRVLFDYPFWENDGQGNFSLINPPANFDNSGAGFKIADMDGDGWLDVLYHAPNDQLRVKWNQGPGLPFVDAFFGALGAVNPGNYFATLTNDFDLDGDQDVFAFYPQTIADSISLKLKLVRQEPGADELSTITLWKTASDPGASSLSASVLDLNADTFPDIAIMVGNLSRLLLFENQNGTGEFILRDSLQGYRRFIVGDIDLDGDKDLFVFNRNTFNVENNLILTKQSTYVAKNTGSFTLDAIFIDSINAGDKYLLADINGDLLPDFVSLGDKYDYTYFLSADEGQLFCRYAIDADGHYTAPQPLTKAFGHIRDFVNIDWNEDSASDILLAVESGIYWAENQAAQDTFPFPTMIWEAPTHIENLEFVLLNDDGIPDGVGTLVDYATSPFLYTPFVWLADPTNNTGSSITFPEIALVNDEHIITGKLDADADNDLIALNADGQFIFIWNEDNEGNGFVVESSNLMLPVNYTALRTFMLADINLDGRSDLIIGTSEGVFYNIQLADAGTFEGWIMIDGINDANSILAGDYDSDGQLNLRVFNSNDILIGTQYDSLNQSFISPILIGTESEGYYTPMEELLLNNDPTPDLISVGGFHINIPNSPYLTTAYQPAPFPLYWTDLFPPDFYNNAQRTDIDGDGKSELLAGVSAINTYNAHFLQGGTVEGLVRWDTSLNCTFDSLHPTLPTNMLFLNSGLSQQLSQTTPDGHYAFLLPDAPQHELSVIPMSFYWDVCPPDSTLASNIDHSVHFTVSANTACPLMELDMALSPIRQCFNSTVSLAYKNTGTLPASPVSISLHFDERMTPVQSSHPWASITDSTMVFEFDTVAIGEEGLIIITMEPDCQNLVMGEILCYEAFITPDSLCIPATSSWGGANLQASYFCEGDSIAFVIENTGTGTMPIPEYYQLNIVNDDIVLFETGDILLDPGQIDTVRAAASTDGYLFELEQPDGHPNPEPISLLTEGCLAPLDTSLLNDFPGNNGNSFSVERCDGVDAPYDPNNKVAIPGGYSDQHFIAADQPIQYTINFQNIGTDAAKTVTIRDQLSTMLDLTTFEAGAASHPYEWVILPDRTLSITFTDINLPDSTSNEAASKGFFSFNIQPINEILPFNSIENSAAIYFDFNPPIITNRTMHIIEKPKVTEAVYTSLCAGETYLGQLMVADTILKETHSFASYDSIVWHHINLLNTLDTTLIYVNLDEAGQWQGINITQDTLILFTAESSIGCDSLIGFQISITNSIENPFWASEIKLHPNPTSEWLGLYWQNLPAESNIISIYDVLGKQVAQQKINYGATTFRKNIKNWAPGIYILKLQSGQETASWRFVIQ